MPAIIICFLLYVIITVLNFQNGQTSIFYVSDSVFYYTYLPAFFIFHDLDLNFLNNYLQDFVLQQFLFCGYIKYPIGTAVFQSPLFLTAHFLAKLFNPDVANGYSNIYLIANSVTALLFYLFGIILNYKTLVRFIDKNLAQIIIIAISFGTGLLHYTTLEFGMSHVYSFFSVSLFLYLIIKYNNFHCTDLKKRIIHSFILGLSLGLLTSVRNINVLTILVYFLYGIQNKKGLKIRFLKFFRPSHIIPFTIGFLIVLIPQFLYWHYWTGHFIINSYRPEKYIENFVIDSDDYFYLDKPHIFDSLFSLRAGLFVYYPVLILSVPGFLNLKKYFKNFLYAIPLFFAVIICLLSCYNCWYGGHSYGIRFYLDYLPLFEILIAAFFQKMYDEKNNYFFISTLTSALIVFCLILYILFYLNCCDVEGNVFAYL